MFTGENHKHLQARTYRYLANGMSDGRKYTAPLLGFLIATEIVDTQKLQYAAGVSEATDFFDGLMGKKSHALEPNDVEKIDGGERDHKADKWFFRGIMSGLVMKALRHGQYKRAALYTGVAVVQTVRDYKVQEWRDQAIQQSIDVSASNAARAKTAINDIAVLVALDQDKHIPHSEAVADALFVGATVLSLTTMLEYRKAFIRPVTDPDQLLEAI